ncbi:MAG: MarR family transcriptional regulator [Bacteroidota bacterium]
MSDKKQIQAFATLLHGLSVQFANVTAEHVALHDTLSKPEALAVAFIGVESSVRMGALADHLGVVQSAVTPLVDRLEASGLVERVRSTADRRVWHVKLTKAGQQAYGDHQKLYATLAARMLEPLSSIERDLLISLLTRITE